MRDTSKSWPGDLARLSAVAVVAAVAVLAVAPEAGAAPMTDKRAMPAEMVLLPGQQSKQAAGRLLEVLSAADAGLYRQIFKLQEAGRWQAADKLIAELSDRMLMGHLLFQRYMHPRAYRSKYAELTGWLKKYADHPDARRIYKLAVKRRPKNYLWPQEPRRPAVNVRQDETVVTRAEPVRHAAPDFARRYTRGMRYGQMRIRRWLRLGAPTRALKYLNTESVNRHFDTIGFDRSLSAIAAGFFYAGKDQQALEHAMAAAERSGPAAPKSYWWAGLAAWRLGQYELAAQHFDALANSYSEDEWLVSAGGYWAARAYLVSRQPANVVPMLKIASRHPLTFYGVLAQETLARQVEIDWSSPLASPVAASGILSVPAARRGLALLQIGQERRGMKELKRVLGRLPVSMLETMLAAAEEGQIASLAYQVGIALKRRHGHWHGAALFPIPGWTPTGGYSIDRALIFAYMRQESNFKTGAKSSAGARGLMQLMPGTAGFMAGRRFRGARRNQLYDPQLNITLGQKYIRYLLEREPGIDGNLFYAVAAYNGGPGNLRRWLRGMKHRDDPLLFLESIPRKETRDYVELVMTNFWLYRDRLGQPRPSLADVVAGGWPVYSALDPLNQQVVLRKATEED